MAGEAILANIVTEILKKVGSFALEEINLSRSVKKELEKLKKTILMIEAVISDAENKQVKEKFVEIWLKELKDLAYEADDILDEYAYDVMHRQGLNRKRDKLKLCYGGQTLKEIDFTYPAKIFLAPSSSPDLNLTVCPRFDLCSGKTGSGKTGCLLLGSRKERRKMRYISELERKVETPQTEATALPAQMTML